MSQAGSLSSEIILPPEVPLTFSGNSGSGSAVANNFDIVGTGAISTTVVGDTLTISTSASGTVTSVLGVANRITSTGGNTPVIDIAATYVGQTSLTTLGTIATGVWNGTKISEAYGGTNQSTYATGDILYASGANTLAKLAAGSNTNVLTLAGGVPTWAAPATSGTVTSVTGTTNRISVTPSSPNPVVDIDAAYVGQASITTLGTITTGVWNGTDVDLASGGTNASLTASNGGIFYSTATAGAILSGTATAGQMLRSGASSAPTWSTATFPSTATTTGTILRADGTNWVATTATYPATTTINQILFSSAANTISGITTANNGILTTGTTGVPGVLAAGTAGAILRSGAPAAWSTTTYPATNAINTILYASAANVMSALATANNGVLSTSATGVPSIATAGTAATPTCVGGTTPGTTVYTIQVGRSFRLGPLVIYSFVVAGTFGATAAGNVTISAPVTSINTANLNQYGAGVANINATFYTGAFQNVSNTALLLFLNATNLTPITVVASGTFNFQGSITYFAA